MSSLAFTLCSVFLTKFSSIVKDGPRGSTSDGGSSRRLNVCYAAMATVQTCKITGGEIMATMRDAERYCDQQLSNRIPTLGGGLINDVRTALSCYIFNLQKLANTSTRDRPVAFQQQTNSDMDEHTSAIKLGLEQL